MKDWRQYVIVLFLSDVSDGTILANIQCRIHIERIKTLNYEHIRS